MVAMHPPAPRAPKPVLGEGEQAATQDAQQSGVVQTEAHENAILSSESSIPVTPPQTDGRPYTIPEWSHAPGQPYKLEVVKEGGILGVLDVSSKAAYMFGRSDICDFLLEHPTSSRHHAVIQYNKDGEAFLFDLGSTHGTSINKRQVKGKVYVPLHVGDIIRFGLSSRLYVFQGPVELMPEEGLSRKERSFLKVLEEAQRNADQKESCLRARQDAISSQGITWGMDEDAVQEEEEEVTEEVTWQNYQGQLNEKQQKTLDKVHKRNEKLANLKKEIDAIQAKEFAQGGLTQGQQTQVARNEQRIEQLLEELENLEETLNESIRESLGAKSQKEDSSRKKKSRGEEEEGDLSDDEFYDRTTKSRKVARKGDTPQVETAESLLDKKHTISQEIEALSISLKVEQGKARPENEGTSKEPDSIDPLDAFMSSVSTKLVEDHATSIMLEIERLQNERGRIDRLLKIADPTGEAAAKWTLKVESETANVQQISHDISIDVSSGTRMTNQDPKTVKILGVHTPEVAFESEAEVPTALSPTKVASVGEPSSISQDRDGSSEHVLTEMANLTSENACSNKVDVAPKGGQSDCLKDSKPKASSRRYGPEKPAFLEMDEDTAYDSWIPPQGQTGDGRTSLNDKYGY